MPLFARISIVSGAYVSSLLKGVRVCWSACAPLMDSTGDQDALRVEVEVKLPCVPLCGYLPLSIGQGDSELDELQDINVAAHCLVMIIRRCFKLPDRSCYYGWKFTVLFCHFVRTRYCARPGPATRTIETKGKSSIKRRRMRISSSKLFAHTSRVASRIDAAGIGFKLCSLCSPL